MRSPAREKELIEEAVADGASLGIDREYVENLMNLVLTHSRAAQRRALD